MRIAVLADIHGNLPALRAVLADVERESVESIVVAGDVAGGPLIRDSLELLAARHEPILWVRGNAEREAVAAFDGDSVSDDQAGRAALWSAGQLDQRWRDQLAGWPIAVAFDGILFCHATPRSDDEILTRATPDAVMLEALGDAGERLAVGGHIHQQQLRRIDGRLVYANPGSVGLPYEGRPGAFWMILDEACPSCARARMTSPPPSPSCAPRDSPTLTNTSANRCSPRPIPTTWRHSSSTSRTGARSGHPPG